MFGTTGNIPLGTVRVAGKLLFYGGFYATRAPNAAGKGLFGGKATEYNYFADVQIAVGCGLFNSACAALINVWDQSGKLFNLSTSFNFTIPGGGGSVSPPAVGQPPIQFDLGVSAQGTYSYGINDYGSGGPRTLSGNQLVPFTKVGGSPGALQYSFNPATSTYTFSAADAGKIVTIIYTSVFSLYYYVETQAAQIPSVGPFTISPNNQTYFAQDQGVTFYSVTDGNVPGVKVGGTPSAHYQYSVSSGFGGGVYTFYSGDAGKFVYIQYEYTSNNPNVTNQSKLNLFFSPGQKGQSVWSYMQSKYPSQALGYTGIAWVGANPMALGTGGSLPSYNYEISGLFIPPGGGLDANPLDALKGLLTDPLIGIRFPSVNLDAWTSAYNYVGAVGYYISKNIDTQASLAEIFEPILQAGNMAPVWSNGLLKIIPYGDSSVAGNGLLYTPPGPAATLTWDDLLPINGNGEGGKTVNQSPIQYTTRAPQDCWNYVQAQYTNRLNDYNSEPLNEQNDAFISKYGQRIEEIQTWDWITSNQVAAWALRMRLNRQCYLRETQRFALSYRFARLEVMDMVVLPTGETVRITQIQDDPSGRLNIEAEQWGYGSSTATIYPKQSPNSYQPNFSQAVPGNSIPIFVPNTLPQAVGVQNKLQIAATGQNPNWGGCKVYVSLDGNTYSPIGVINATGLIGVLSAALPLTLDPDTSDTLSVDLNLGLAANVGGATLVSVTRPQADAYVSLCAIVDQVSNNVELISYQTATLTGTARYNLGTYMRRGVYGTTVAAHTIGAFFAYLGPSYQFLDYQYPPQSATSIFFVKLQSFNLSGGQVQDLATCKVWAIPVGFSGGFIQETYVPSAWTPTTSSGGATVTNPSNAWDKNFGSAAVFDSPAGALEQGYFSGFPNFVTTQPMTLYVAYQNASIAAGPPYNNVATLLSANWAPHTGGYFFANPRTDTPTVLQPAQGIVSLNIPVGINLNAVQVLITNGGVVSTQDCHFEILEIWIQ